MDTQPNPGISSPVGLGLKGRWKSKKLGSGGFGTVHLWENQEAGEIFAIKSFKKVTSPPVLQKCREEVQRMLKISHPNIVKAMELPPDPELNQLLASRVQGGIMPLLCMEYCERGDLQKLIYESDNIRGLPEVEVRAIVRDISRAVTYLHRGEERVRIIHRDIKPENILCQWDPSRNRVVYKLGDLGLAKNVSRLETSNFSSPGTNGYQAPEIVQNRKHTYTVDYWSFGMTVYEISFGYLAFKDFRDQIYDAIRKEKKEFQIALPSEHQLSAPFRQDLSLWLISTLTFNPVTRGQMSSGNNDNVPCLKWMKQALKQPILDLLAPSNSGEPKVYIKDVSMDLNAFLKHYHGNTQTKDVLLFAKKRKGPNPHSVESPSLKILQPKDRLLDFKKEHDLILIPKSGTQVSSKIMPPERVAKFLTTAPTLESLDPSSFIRNLRADTLFYMQRERKRTGSFYEILLDLEEHWPFPVPTPEEAEKMKFLQECIRDKSKFLKKWIDSLYELQVKKSSKMEKTNAFPELQALEGKAVLIEKCARFPIKEVKEELSFPPPDLKISQDLMAHVERLFESWDPNGENGGPQKSAETIQMGIALFARSESVLRSQFNERMSQIVKAKLPIEDKILGQVSAIKSLGDLEQQVLDLLLLNSKSTQLPERPEASAPLANPVQAPEPPHSNNGVLLTTGEQPRPGASTSSTLSYLQSVATSTSGRKFFLSQSNISNFQPAVGERAEYGTLVKPFPLLTIRNSPATVGNNRNPHYHAGRMVVSSTEDMSSASDSSDYSE